MLLYSEFDVCSRSKAIYTIFILNFIYFCLLLLLFYLLKVRGNFCGLFLILFFSFVGRLKLTKFGNIKAS